MRKAAFVRLTPEQRAELIERLKHPALKAQQSRLFQILLVADEGRTDEHVAVATGASLSTVERTRKRFAAEGLEAAVAHKPRSGAPAKFRGKQAAMIVALASSDAPEGHARQTCDLDLMVPENEREAWKDMLRELGYPTPLEQEAFIQFGPPAPGAWPIDLLVVTFSTFAKVEQAAVSTTLSGVSCKIPTVDHLLAMKFHALKYVHGVTTLKYLQDVHGLLALTFRAVTDDDVRKLCLQHGNQEVYERLVSTSV